MALVELLAAATMRGVFVWLSGLVVSPFGIRARGRLGFESRVAPPFHWAAALGKSLPFRFLSQFLSSKKLGYTKGVFGA